MDDAVPIARHTKCIATDKYIKEYPDELSFDVGEVLIILEPSEVRYWYLAENSNRERGIVPITHLEIINIASSSIPETPKLPIPPKIKASSEDLNNPLSTHQGENEPFALCNRTDVNSTTAMPLPQNIAIAQLVSSVSKHFPDRNSDLSSKSARAPCAISLPQSKVLPGDSPTPPNGAPPTQPKVSLRAPPTPPKVHLGAPPTPPKVHLGAPPTPPKVHLGAPPTPPKVHLGASPTPPKVHLGAPPTPLKVISTSAKVPSKPLPYKASCTPSKGPPTPSKISVVPPKFLSAPMKAPSTPIKVPSTPPKVPTVPSSTLPLPLKQYATAVDFKNKSGWFRPSVERVLMEKLKLNIHAFNCFTQGIYFFQHKWDHGLRYVAFSYDVHSELIQIFQALYDKSEDDLNPLETAIKMRQPDAAVWSISAWKMENKEELFLEAAKLIIKYRTLHPCGLNREEEKTKCERTV